MNCFLAHKQVLKLEDALEGMERVSAEGKTYYDDAELVRVDELVQKFREARLEPGAESHSALRDIRDRAVDRLKALKSLHHAAKSPALVTPAPEPVTVAMPTVYRGLKIKLPTFSGSIMDWDSFWELFSSLLDKEKHLTYSEKKCHLINAMGTPEAQAKAQDAFDFTTTYEEAVARLKETYERKKVVHAAHLKELMQPDLFTNRRSDLVRALDRMERNVRGLTRVGGYTASQMTAGTYEAMMDPTLLAHWRRFTSKSPLIPTDETLKAFLKEHQEYAPDEIAKRPSKVTPAPSRPPRQQAQKTVLSTNSSSDRCQFCSQDHGVFHCNVFNQKDLRQRHDCVRTAGLCFNCLRPGHRIDECRILSRCQKCGAKHHTLLHPGSTLTNDSESMDEVTVNIVNHPVLGDSAFPLPSTAIVSVRAEGLSQLARAQMDSGATISLISRQLAQTLRAPRIPHSSTQIRGVGGVCHSPHQVEVTLIGHGGEQIPARFHVVDRIPSTESRANVSRIFALPFLQGLSLADPGYCSANRIDLLLDMGLANSCSLDGVRYSSNRCLKAERTIFGWMVGGHDSKDNQQEETTLSCLRISAFPDDTESLLTKFWELDQLTTDEQPLTADDQQAVNHFIEHVQRDEDGRYHVSLPRKLPTPRLGESRQTAQKRFLSNERSLKRRGMLDSFNHVVREYGELGHAELIPEKELNKTGESHYYLPMHSVVKQSSTSTKLRVVFDASAKTTSGLSLNDTLLTGPSLYPLLTSVVNKFRTHTVAMTSDISKMFREVGLNPEEFDHHRFLQRDDQHQIRDWRMKRLTFGVSSSPYLATQVLRKLAEDHQQDHPMAAALVKTDFYVDDCLTGAPNLSEAEFLRRDLSSMFMKGQMTLCKWRSNSEELLATVPQHLRETSNLTIVTDPGGHSKTLGLHWDTKEDCFHVATPEADPEQQATKRIVASIIARTFDVLGWFAPATLPAKVLLRESWAMHLDWDDPFPAELQQRWSAWVSQLPLITSFPIPRCLGSSSSVVVSRQLHGFSDASLIAYGGVVYVRTFYADLSVSINLISSKARIAPLKALTVPRLELCGALLLAQLMTAVARDLAIPEESVFGWCDSSTVLGWLNKDPSHLCTFVANRISKLSSLVSSPKWRYVATGSNPADLLSRGVPPQVLGGTPLWWKGPVWLALDPSQWPRRPDINLERELPELKAGIMLASVETEEMGLGISSYERLIRVVAWVLRFGSQCRGKGKSDLSLFLTLTELRLAKLAMMKHCQRTSYQEEFHQLQAKKTLASGHSLASLSPFIDEEGLLRVGGRLQHADLSSAITHPIILDSRSHIVQLMVEQTHRTLLHAGSSTVMATLSQTFYIPRLRNLLRKIASNCVACHKANARTAQQYMGELPAARAQPARPFSITGVDFAGPVHTKRGNPRHPTLVKTYLCLFVCFSTKAIHLEVVSDMTTQAFVAALTRFTARRGLPTDMYSDNGSNFLGAHAELRKMLEQLRSEESLQSVNVWASRHHINWHFSPARAPHFGGLWEAAVRSLKSLLKRTLGEQNLTFEELSTITAEAEAVLNSRPLVPLDSLPDDAIAPLTPGHFLVGGPLMALPIRPDYNSKLCNLRRWNLVQRLSHDLWRRWQNEYLILLQKRTKWKKPQLELKQGDIVLVKDRDSFQRSWPMGRVEQTYPGKDGHVRVVDVFSNGKIFRRPIAKLVLLKEDTETSFSGGECLGLHPEIQSEQAERRSPEVMTRRMPTALRTETTEPRDYDFNYYIA